MDENKSRPIMPNQRYVYGKKTRKFQKFVNVDPKPNIRIAKPEMTLTGFVITEKDKARKARADGKNAHDLISTSRRSRISSRNKSRRSTNRDLESGNTSD